MGKTTSKLDDYKVMEVEVEWASEILSEGTIDVRVYYYADSEDVVAQEIWTVDGEFEVTEEFLAFNKKCLQTLSEKIYNELVEFGNECRAEARYDNRMDRW